MGSNAGAWDRTPDTTVLSEAERLLRETKKLEEEQEMFLVQKRQLDTQNRLLIMKKRLLEEQVNEVSKPELNS